MTKAEKKQPALHMMIGDYFKDPLLGQASLISRAVWYELLMFMWEGDRRGEIVTTPVRLMGLVRCRDIEEILHFINEIIEIEFGYIEFENGVSFPVNMASCNEKVTLRNRRMYAEFKNRQNTRLRVERHRKKKVVTPKKERCNADVTPSSSVSSSITITKKKKGIKKFIPPSENEVIKYFLKNGYLAKAGGKAFRYYDAANWKDAKGSQVKNWKQKMIGVWFKDENKDTTTPKNQTISLECDAGPCQAAVKNQGDICESCQEVLRDAGVKTYDEFINMGCGDRNINKLASGLFEGIE